MSTADLAVLWTRLEPFERAVVRDVYFRRRTIAQAATRLQVTSTHAAGSLMEALRLVCDTLAEPAASVPSSAGAVATNARRSDRRGWWRWDTDREDMQWSDGLFGLYGYPPGAVAPTIGRHQAHKRPDVRARAAAAVLAGATEFGEVVMPQTLLDTAGREVHVVMRVRREPASVAGDREILVGQVVEVAAP